MRTFDRTGWLVGAVGAALILLLLVDAVPAEAKRGKTTRQRVIVGPDPNGGFSALSFEKGDRYRTRDALISGELMPKRRSRRTSLAYFGQISDLQLADEESPGRVEWFDGEPFVQASNSGFRPNETIAPQAIDAAVRGMNQHVRSPLRDRKGKRARMLNVMLTGDLADNMHVNEVEWMRILLEGGRIDPNSGTASNSGAACLPGVELEDPKLYSGVQDYDDYEPDNPLYYDPSDPRGEYSNWPTYPGMLDRAQEPFRAKGLKVPSYSVVGNHDVLFQGTSAALPGFEEIALGCLKYSTAILGSGFLSRQNPETNAFERMLDPQAATRASTLGADAGVFLVPDDPDRQFVDRRQYKAIVGAGSQRDDHGFAYVDPGELAASNGHASYFSFKPRRGVRFIVIDSNAEAGVLIGPTTDGSQGNIDDPQWKWLRSELEKAERRGELVLTFAHHPIRTITNDFADELSPCGPDDGHGHGTTPSCDFDPRDSQPLHLGDDLEALFHEYPNMIAFVAGHAHRNKVTLYKGGDNGFWQIETPAIADWPAASRLIEIFDNRDGTLSIFGTLIDTKASPGVPGSGTEGSSLSRRQMASLHRAMAFNDPQGSDSARGKRRDRNVELLIDDPR